MISVRLRIYATNNVSKHFNDLLNSEGVYENKHLQIKYSGSSGNYEVFDMTFKDITTKDFMMNPNIIELFFSKLSMLDPIGRAILQDEIESLRRKIIHSYNQPERLIRLYVYSINNPVMFRLFVNTLGKGYEWMYLL